MKVAAVIFTLAAAGMAAVGAQDYNPAAWICAAVFSAIGLDCWLA